MSDYRPITPPLELVEQWRTDYMIRAHTFIDVAKEIAQWGADQELEACCEVLARELICDGKHVATDLRMIRRPKPPSLKELALEALDRMDQLPTKEDQHIIRRALTQPEQDDKTLKSIRETTPRYRMSVIVSTNDSAIDTRMNVIWQALDLSKEILESVSLPEQLPPLGNQ